MTLGTGRHSYKTYFIHQYLFSKSSWHLLIFFSAEIKFHRYQITNCIRKSEVADPKQPVDPYWTHKYIITNYLTSHNTETSCTTIMTEPLIPVESMQIPYNEALCFIQGNKPISSVPTVILLEHSYILTHYYWEPRMYIQKYSIYVFTHWHWKISLLQPVLDLFLRGNKPL